MPQQSAVLQHLQIAGGVVGGVDAVLLRRIAVALEVVASPVGDRANDLADALFHPADRVGNSAPFFFGSRCRGPPLGKDRRQFRHIGVSETEPCLHLAAIGMTDVNRQPLRRRHLEGNVVRFKGRQSRIGASSDNNRYDHQDGMTKFREVHSCR